MKLVARDCSPLSPQPTAAETAWLRRLVAHLSATDLVVTLSGDRKEDEPIVYCERDGVWWAGRYIGSLVFEGSTLTIAPRFGLETLRRWLAEAISVVLTNTYGQLREDESFIVQLLASVWAHGVAQAARHGLPALRCDVVSEGQTIRGRLDVVASLRSRASNQVVSIRSGRSLDHAASNAIVSAYAVLHRWLAIPDEQWMPARTKQLIGHLVSVTGARPRTPTKAELDRIRYTPITAGFASIAELSRQIANRQGLATNMEARGESEGVLLDVAELWEMYVLSALRKAAAPWTVTHGTREDSATRTLLRSDGTGRGMGTLIPDAILHAGGTVHAVADAKYKSLQPTAAAPNGPQREDLYQMAAYLSRFASANNRTSWGALIYPQLEHQASIPLAEQFGPWSFNDGKKVVFTTLPHHAGDAVAKLRALITSMHVPWGGSTIR